MDWSTPASSAFTVSSNTMSSSPEPSSSLGAGVVSAGGVVSAVSVIWVLEPDDIPVPEKSDTAPAKKYRYGSAYPMTAWRCVSVRVSVMTAALPVESTEAPPRCVPPEVPAPSRMRMPA